ncbi:hypothetical protein [Embleya sp. NPDC005971]|uniref:hypothetical protein n=1 Tax=Embleya sp. NPDC005971 TaxID=3156724 RepID=UPI0033E0162F
MNHRDPEAIAAVVDRLANKLADTNWHELADEGFALVEALRYKPPGPWEAVFEPDDGRYLHLGHGSDEPTVQARATAWAISFDGTLDWHDPQPDGTRYATFRRNDGVEPGMFVRPSDPAERALRRGEHHRATRIRYRAERNSARAHLARIAGAHHKEVTAGGTTSGDCTECGWTWPCPTHTWATTKRDLCACWNPNDDEEADQ